MSSFDSTPKNICPFMSTAALIPKQLNSPIDTGPKHIDFQPIPVYNECVKERCVLWDDANKRCGLVTLFKRNLGSLDVKKDKDAQF